jgi:integrase
MRSDTSRGMTKAPGVLMIKPGFYRLHARRVDPRRQGARAKERLFEGSLQQAKLERAKLVQELLDQTEVPTVEALTFKSYSRSWLKLRASTVSTNTALHYSSIIANDLWPSLGSLYLDKMDRGDIQAFINGLVDKMALASIKTKFRVLRSIWRDVIADYALPDITHRVKFPTGKAKNDEDTNSLQPEELGRFLDAWKGKRDEAMVWVLASTGLRWCHVSGMRWEDIDWDKKIVRVRRAHVKGIISEVNKIKKAPSQAPLADIVVEKLKAHRVQLMKEGTDNPDGWCFPGLSGKPKVPSSIRKPWKKALSWAAIYHRFSVHGLRRSFNDLCRRAKVDGIIVRSFTGHSSDEMREHYSSVGTEEKRETVGKILQLVVRS